MARSAVGGSVKLLLLTLVLVPGAATAGMVGKENPEPGAAKARWTAERLRAARPLPMAAVSEDSLQALTEAVEAAAPAMLGGRGEADGSAPLPGMRPAGRRLFEGAREADPDLPQIDAPAKGSTGAYFTSHRLIPAEAHDFYPYSTVGILFFHIPGVGDRSCTAAVIRKRLIVTAGQCVHSGDPTPGFYEDFLFVPTYIDGFGAFEVWEWEYIVVHTTWSQGGGTLPNAADYALIELGDEFFEGATRKIGDVVGTLGYVIKKLRPNHATLLGYSSNFDGGELLHQVDAKDLKAAAKNNVEYGSDLRGGSAGGPIIQDFGDNPATVKWIGALSYLYNNTAVKAQGASIPDNRFTGLLSTACAHRAGNC